MNKRAAVIGGGYGGLITAKVLSNYYEEVFLFEKDTLPEKPAERPGTPQAFHPHRFTVRGKEITNAFFPGYEEDLLSLGAPSSFQKTIHQEYPYGKMSFQYPRDDIKFSRSLLEAVIRERVRKIPGIQFFQNHKATGLLFSEDGRVTGVKTLESHSESSFEADLTVDASGRNSKLSDWLKAAGYAVPSEDEFYIHLGYTTQRYKLPSHLSHIAKTYDTIMLNALPSEQPFTLGLSFIENEIAEFFAGGIGGHYPPRDPDHFLKLFQPFPVLSDIINELIPLAGPKTFRVEKTYRRHYEEMADWPKGLLAIGDSLCIVDPIYGQGMTLAGIQAEKLDELLKTRTDNQEFEKSVLSAFQDIIYPAWWLNCAADLRWEGTSYQSERPLPMIAFGKKYMDLLLKHAVTQQNGKLYGLYWAVNTLSVPLAQLFQSGLAISILNSSPEGRLLLDELLTAENKPAEDIFRAMASSITGGQRIDGMVK
ncbi:FAD dependent oxidoreductase [Metabacillus sp. GX 13764]|uniref:NAD(P)/FAD-dependent oxidoreductase n=1 Tax=Metabacillus kandeliae TaxID=2900151 RepID=UPI001E4793C6|nr:FAD dependent oxidoreductase [Metabacillus kandeliae]MCD7034092.1 FAD dependent oxidoreductase [Metabacillus kandeliae]